MNIAYSNGRRHGDDKDFRRAHSTKIEGHNTIAIQFRKSCSKRTTRACQWLLSSPSPGKFPSRSKHSSASFLSYERAPCPWQPISRIQRIPDPSAVIHRFLFSSGFLFLLFYVAASSSRFKLLSLHSDSLLGSMLSVDLWISCSRYLTGKQCSV